MHAQTAAAGRTVAGVVMLVVMAVIVIAIVVSRTIVVMVTGRDDASGACDNNSD